jgi:hypothetical protein
MVFVFVDTDVVDINRKYFSESCGAQTVSKLVVPENSSIEHSVSSKYAACSSSLMNARPLMAKLFSLYDYRYLALASAGTTAQITFARHSSILTDVMH